MSRTKSSDIPHYELLYIISNKFSEDELAPIVEKVDKIIGNNAGKITRKEDWGKKRFAYPIKSFYFGYYSLVEFDLPGENLAAVNRSLTMTSEILRHQIVKRHVKTAAEIEKDKKIAEKIAEKNIQAEEQAEKEKEKTKANAANKDKIDLKDLDDKLDKILETNDLL